MRTEWTNRSNQSFIGRLVTGKLPDAHAAELFVCDVSGLLNSNLAAVIRYEFFLDVITMRSTELLVVVGLRTGEGQCLFKANVSNTLINRKLFTVAQK